MQKRVKGVVQETQFLKTMNLALAKNKESWLKKLKETDELSHIAGPKDLKIQELEVCEKNCRNTRIVDFMFYSYILVTSSRINENSRRRSNRRSSNL